MSNLRLKLAQMTGRTLPPLFAQRVREWIYPRAWAMNQSDREYSVRLQTGSMFASHTNDFHAFPVSIHGYYEWRLLAILLAVYTPGSAIIEAGANIGTETLSFSDLVGDQGKVYAFEPMPDNFLALQKNLAMNNRQNVELYPYAVGSQNTNLIFALPETKYSSGSGYVFRETEKNQVDKRRLIDVKCVTLDSLISHDLPVSMIFMDVEGSEINVLRGAGDIISKFHPVIVLEASKKHQARNGFSIDDLYNTLAQMGYVIFAIDRLGVTEITPETAHSKSNWLAIHQTKRDSLRRIETSIMACGLLPCVPGINPISRTSS